MLVECHIETLYSEFIRLGTDEQRRCVSDIVSSMRKFGECNANDVCNVDVKYEPVMRVYVDENNLPYESSVVLAKWDLESENLRMLNEIDEKIVLCLRKMRGVSIKNPSLVLHRSFFYAILNTGIKNYAESKLFRKQWVSVCLVEKRLHSLARLVCRYTEPKKFGPMLEIMGDGSVCVVYSLDHLKRELKERGVIETKVKGEAGEDGNRENTNRREVRQVRDSDGHKRREGKEREGSGGQKKNKVEGRGARRPGREKGPVVQQSMSFVFRQD